MARRPASVLFACNRNAVRSPIAEAIAKRFYGSQMFVDSAGVLPGEPDALAIAVLAEIGIDLSRQRPKTLAEIESDAFDLVVTLTPEAQHRVMELTRTSAFEMEYWPTYDPAVGEGPRDALLDAYRLLRDDLIRRVHHRFGQPP
ncbi:MAG: low molecular weight phosphatase family protein [Alphaproteobacteria bacterium]|nr:low molecular weight phosphatase family protein [Alphaproteobacteria bacterium]